MSRRVEDEDEPEVTVYFNLSKATGVPWLPWRTTASLFSVHDAAFAASMLKGAREKWGAQFTGRQDAEAEGPASVRSVGPVPSRECCIAWLPSIGEL